MIECSMTVPARAKSGRTKKQKEKVYAVTLLGIRSLVKQQPGKTYADVFKHTKTKRMQHMNHTQLLLVLRLVGQLPSGPGQDNTRLFICMMMPSRAAWTCVSKISVYVVHHIRANRRASQACCH